MKQDELIHELEKYRTLDYNWDTYNAEPIKKQSIDASIKAVKNILMNLNTDLHLIDVFPTKNGFVQIDIDTYYNYLYDYEIEVYNNAQIVVNLFDENSELIKTDYTDVNALKLISHNIEEYKNN